MIIAVSYTHLRSYFATLLHDPSLQLLSSHIETNYADYYLYSTCLLYTSQCLTGRMNIDEYSISAMFAADRLDHLQNETDGLCHKIEEGISVISDRYVFSNYAYQSVSVPLEWLVQLNAQAAKLLRPDCHIFIDVDPTTAMAVSYTHLAHVAQ